MRLRDEQGTNREEAPLCAAEDSIIVDNTELSVAETLKEILTRHWCEEMRNSVLVPEERARLSGTSLKIIACVSMLISHIIASGVWIQTTGLLPVKWETVSALYTTGSILQLTAGRIAFPIFGFLIVEGAQKTHNKKRYLDWLGIGVLVSEIPFVCALRHAP